MRVLDLFSGIGGFSLGLERAGMTTVAFCEVDPFCRAVLAQHWPGVPIYDDVRTLTADTLRRDGIAVDLICGGFPCQDISFAGKRVGLAGERSGLWSEYFRLVCELRPRFVVVENVSGLLSLGLADVLGDLATRGYDATWDCIPAQAVGAPHRRDRVWIVAYANCEGQHDGAVNAEVGGASKLVAHANQQSWDQGRPGDAAEVARRRNADRGGEQPDVCHANVLGLALRQGERGNSRPQFAPTIGTDWWLTEPDVGGRPDGFPAWLVRCVGQGLSYAESLRRVEILRNVWDANVSQALWRAAGGLERISQAEVLFSFVREYEAGTHEARILVAGAEASEDFLRGLRQRGLSRSAPRRPRSGKQRSGKHPDVVQPVPRLLARDSEADWTVDSWEDAVPRVADGVPARVDRLRSLGNAVVPQIPEIIGRAIMAAL